LPGFPKEYFTKYNKFAIDFSGMAIRRERSLPRLNGPR